MQITVVFEYSERWLMSSIYLLADCCAHLQLAPVSEYINGFLINAKRAFVKNDRRKVCECNFSCFFKWVHQRFLSANCIFSAQCLHHPKKINHIASEFFFMMCEFMFKDSRGFVKNASLGRDFFLRESLIDAQIIFNFHVKKKSYRKLNIMPQLENWIVATAKWNVCINNDA